MSGESEGVDYARSTPVGPAVTPVATCEGECRSAAWLAALGAVVDQRDAACDLLHEVIMEAAIDAYQNDREMNGSLLGKIAMFLHDAPWLTALPGDTGG